MRIIGFLAVPYLLVNMMHPERGVTQFLTKVLNSLDAYRAARHSLQYDLNSRRKSLMSGMDGATLVGMDVCELNVLA